MQNHTSKASPSLCTSQIHHLRTQNWPYLHSLLPPLLVLCLQAPHVICEFPLRGMHVVGLTPPPVFSSLSTCPQYTGVHYTEVHAAGFRYGKWLYICLLEHYVSRFESTYKQEVSLIKTDLTWVNSTVKELSLVFQSPQKSYIIKFCIKPCRAKISFTT